MRASVPRHSTAPLRPSLWTQALAPASPLEETAAPFGGWTQSPSMPRVMALGAVPLARRRWSWVAWPTTPPPLLPPTPRRTTCSGRLWGHAGLPHPTSPQHTPQAPHFHKPGWPAKGALAGSFFSQEPGAEKGSCMGSPNHRPPQPLPPPTLGPWEPRSTHLHRTLWGSQGDRPERTEAPVSLAAEAAQPGEPAFLPPALGRRHGSTQAAPAAARWPRLPHTCLMPRPGAAERASGWRAA